MISKLRFENFKSWKKFPETNLGKVTAFFGTNSSGKTSILNFLLMLKQTMESSDRSQVLNLGGQNSYVELGSFDDLIYMHNLDSTLDFAIDFLLPEQIHVSNPESHKEYLFSGKDLGIDVSVKQNAKKRLYVSQLSYDFAGEQFFMKKEEKDKYDYKLGSKGIAGQEAYNFKRTLGRVWFLPEPVKFYGFPDQVHSYFQNAGFLFDLQLKVEESLSRIFYLGPLRDFPKRQYSWSGAQPSDMGQRGERCIDAILAARANNMIISPGFKKKKVTLEVYIAGWLKRLGLIDSFRIDEISDGTNLYRVKVKKDINSSEVLITDVGFGVSQILPIITLCYYVPEDSTILIEQPEIHLHPKVQAGLADLFIDAMKIRNIQIIIESHSEHLLRRLQRRIAEENVTDKDVKIFFCDTENGTSVLNQLDIDMYGDIHNWPKDFFGDEMGEIAAMVDAQNKRRIANE